MKNSNCLIIAEAGVNHNGEIEKAFELVKMASKCKADYIKFQMFDAKSLVTPNAKKAKYQFDENQVDSQYVMLKKLELSFEDLKRIKVLCDEKNIGFICSAFDVNSIRKVFKLGVKFFKIPSGEINNLPYLRVIAQFNKKILLSTGISSLKEINDAIEILVSNGTKKSNICILHCSSEYPTKMKDVNLKSMLTIKHDLKLNVGYSDHTIGNDVAVSAVAMGASVIEKHFTLDKNLPGPDHKASLNPDEFSNFVKSIRNIEDALGSSQKRPNPSELKNLKAIRKSIVALKKIKKNDTFTEKNITTKRPAIGINPMEWDNVIGKKAKKEFYENDLIEL